MCFVNGKMQNAYKKEAVSVVDNKLFDASL